MASKHCLSGESDDQSREESIRPPFWPFPLGRGSAAPLLCVVVTVSTDSLFRVSMVLETVVVWSKGGTSQQVRRDSG
jgi:hypothetical protein